MEVILLERVAKLGQMGDAVRVKDGFARNFLLPRGKALRATAENRARFETMKGDSKRALSRLRPKRRRLPTSLTARASPFCVKPRNPVSCLDRFRRATLSA